MGFVLSVLYFITYYLTPAVIFGPLAAYRIELILAGLTFLVSLPRLTKSFVWRTPQTLALFGLALAAFLSSGVQWLHAGLDVFLVFIPNPLAYFLVCLYCDSKKKLQIVALMLLFVCLFVIAHGYVDLQSAPAPGSSVQPEGPGGGYLMPFGGFYRLRGLGMINDPNDFAQVIAVTLPLIFLFWSPNKAFRNIVFVILPACVLLFGAYLTHSRGGMIAILVMAILAARRRIRTFPAILLAVALYAGAMALNFTGGRAISANAGEDRTGLWGESMELMKSHPVFGVGYGNLPDYLGGFTAHNSVMVCGAELGFVGLFFWCLFLYPTVRDALTIASPAKLIEAKAIAVEGDVSLEECKIEAFKLEIVRLGHLMVLSLTGFLVSGWFLSRAYVLTLFLLGGTVEVIYERALHQGLIVARLPLARVMLYAGGLTAALVFLMYVLLRTVNLTH